MTDIVRNWLDKAIHNSDHLETVSKRMLDFQKIKEGLSNKNKEITMQSFINFYIYIEQDHELYGAPSKLIEAAIARTHFFHGVIHSLLLRNQQSTAYTYSLMIVYHNKIDEMKDPETALNLTIEILDAYFEYLKVIGELQMGEFSEKTITIIDINIEKPLSTQMIADALSLNPDYLGRKVKEETGSTITELIYKRKINLAKFYLQNTDLPVKQVANNLGIEDASYFGKIFKKYTGLSPNNYKSLKHN